MTRGVTPVFFVKVTDPQTHKFVFDSNKKKLITSAISVGIGGLAVALSKMAVSSGMGLKLNLKNINITNTTINNCHILFSESPSRIITTVHPSNKKRFESFFKKNQLSLLGKITKSKKIVFEMTSKTKFEVNITSLNNKYKTNLYN